jgi:IS4 transposase
LENWRCSRSQVIKDDAGKRMVFLTHNFTLKPGLIADLYRQRWQVELFFKWIKQLKSEPIFCRA